MKVLVLGMLAGALWSWALPVAAVLRKLRREGDRTKTVGAAALLVGMVLLATLATVAALTLIC